MKRIFSIFLCIIIAVSFTQIDAIATNDVEELVKNNSFSSDVGGSSRATGLITSYELSLDQSGTTLYIYGLTTCILDIQKCGFKDLKIQRRKSSSYSWTDYYEYGNVYVEAVGANLSTTLVVERGYQYRISCKHYAKKSLLVTQSISNTSNVVTVS